MLLEKFAGLVVGGHCIVLPTKGIKAASEWMMRAEKNSDTKNSIAKPSRDVPTKMHYHYNHGGPKVYPLDPVCCHYLEDYPIVSDHSCRHGLRCNVTSKSSGHISEGA